jgi:hypothetical protein
VRRSEPELARCRSGAEAARVPSRGAGRAVRAARADAVASPAARTALAHLRVLGSEEITQCVDDQRTRDASYAAFSVGDLSDLP